MLANSLTPLNDKRPDLPNRAARKFVSTTTLNPKGLIKCFYQNHSLKTSPNNTQCHWTGALKYSSHNPVNTRLWVTTMKDNRTESNVVQLFSAKQPRDINRQSRIATPFIAKSNPSGSPLIIEVTGQLAKDIRLDAMAVGKDPENYAVDGLSAWYGIEKGFLA